jgi:hypothetical protein
MAWKRTLTNHKKMRVSRSNESLQIKVNSREVKDLDHFKYLGSVLTRDGYCTRKTK